MQQQAVGDLGSVTRKLMASLGDRGQKEGLGVRNALSGLREPGKVPRTGESGGGALCGS